MKSADWKRVCLFLRIRTEASRSRHRNGTNATEASIPRSLSHPSGPLQPTTSNQKQNPRMRNAQPFSPVKSNNSNNNNTSNQFKLIKYRSAIYKSTRIIRYILSDSSFSVPWDHRRRAVGTGFRKRLHQRLPHEPHQRESWAATYPTALR